MIEVTPRGRKRGRQPTQEIFRIRYARQDGPDAKVDNIRRYFIDTEEITAKDKVRLKQLITKVELALDKISEYATAIENGETIEQLL